MSPVLSARVPLLAAPLLTARFGLSAHGRSLLHTSAAVRRSAAQAPDPPTSPQAATPTAEEHRPKLSLLQSVLYGVQGDREPIKEEDRVTYSKKLARGKYVHELAVHEVKPDCMDRYVSLVSQHYPEVEEITEGNGFYAGGWQTMVGHLDQATHLWEYKGYAGYHKARECLAEHAGHQAFVKDMKGMLRSRKNEICLEFAFWSTSTPRTQGGVYELRTYTLKPGTLLEWEMNWRRGLDVRRKYCEPVGAWFSQLGHLNTVHNMWIYPDLQTRKQMREEAWKVPGWAETVHNTVPLIEDMQAQILEPLPCSPLK